MTRKRTRPRDRITQASCLLITALLIVSAVSAGVGTGTASAEPAGMVSVPDQNITEDIPADASVPLGASQLHDGRILTDSHAMSLDVILTTPARAADIAGRDSASLTGDMALILRDTEHSAGRRVAIDSGLLQTALGYEPEAIHGTHENGEQWTAEATYVDGYLVFDVPHFSTNIVEFSAQVQVFSQSASHGSQIDYSVSNTDVITDPTVEFTGISNAHWDNQTGTTSPSGGGFAVSAAGDAVTGATTDAPATLEVTGHQPAYNPAGGNGDDYALVIAGDESNPGTNHENKIIGAFQIKPKVSGGIDKLVLHMGYMVGESEWGSTGLSFRIEQGKIPDEGATPNGDYMGYVPNPVEMANNNNNKITVDVQDDISVQSGQYYYINVIPDGTTGDGSDSTLYVTGIDTYDDPNPYWAGTTEYGKEQVRANVDVLIGQNTTDLSASTPSGQSVSFGDFQPGETKTRDINIDPSTTSVNFSGNGGPIDYNLKYKERSYTKNPIFHLNGESVSVDGTLQPGETVTKTFSKTVVNDGVNTVKTLFASDTTADAPERQVKFDYSHRAGKRTTVNYTAGQFTERYNISETYGTKTKQAEAYIPFNSNVVSIKTLDYRINNGAWNKVKPTDRRLKNNNLTVYLSESYGGALPSGATIDLRATGRQIDVINGRVSVTDPTKPGKRLDTQLEIESRSEGFAINVGPTTNGERVHYAYSRAYPTQDYVIIDGAGNQRLYLPESHTGDRFHIKHLQARANVVAGDVKITVADPDKPKLDIAPGPAGSGDTVELTYYSTQPGNRYLLESITREVILDSGTANSPVTFVDDDSHEMWRILLESGGGGDTGGGGGLIGVASGAASSAGSAVSGLIPAISVPALGGIGGVGSAGFALILAGAVAVLVYGNVFGRITGIIASLNPFGGTPASGGGADTGNGGSDTSGVTSALSGVVTRAGRVGGTAGVRVLRATTQLLTTSTRIIGRESARLARYLAANPSVALGLGGVGVAVAAYQGLVQLTPQATTAILIGSGGLVTYLVLQRTGTFSWLSFGLIFGAFVILGAGAINPDVLASFGASLQDILPLLVIVGAYVVYRILQTRSQDASTPDTIVRFTGGSGSGSDDNNN